MNTAVLITHTLGIDSAPLAMILAEKTRGFAQRAFVITWHTSHRELDTKKIKTHPSLLSGNGVHVASYETIDPLLDPLQNCLLVFDSAAFATAIFGTDRLAALAKRNTIYLLCTLGVTKEVLSDVKKALPSAYIASAAFADYGQKLDFELHTSVMTPRQFQVYTTKRDQELKGDPKTARFYLKSQQICNLAYPEAIQALLDSSSHPGLDPRIPEAKTIVAEYPGNLLADGPKLEDLLVYLALNREKRCLLYTRYAHYYGVDLLEALFSKHKLRAYAISNKQDSKTRDSVIRGFNQNPKSGGVLVTNVVFRGTVPKGINEIHMLDGSLHNSLLLVKACYKYSNYEGQPLPPKLSVHYHVSRGTGMTGAGSEPTADVVQYNEEALKWQRDLDLWTQLTAVAKPIILLPDGRLDFTSE